MPRFYINGEPFECPEDHVLGRVVRKLAGVSETTHVWSAGGFDAVGLEDRIDLRGPEPVWFYVWTGHQGYVYSPYVVDCKVPLFSIEELTTRRGMLTRYSKKLIRSDYFSSIPLTALFTGAGTGEGT